MAKLIVKRKGDTVKIFELDPARAELILGSGSDNDLVLKETPVSIQHLRIENINGNYYLETLHADLATILNGRPLLRRVQIVQGDEIAIGDLRLQFVNEPSDPPGMGRGAEMEVIDDHYLDNKLVNEVVAKSVRNEVVIEKESAIKAEVADPHAQTELAEDYFQLEELPEDSLTAETPVDPEYTTKITSGSSFQLTAIYGPYLGKRFQLRDGDTRIGRDNNLNDIVIRLNDKGALDPSISRRHATISHRNGRFFISDKRSKTRTFVNQVKLTPTDEIPIEAGDEIEIVSDQRSTIFRLLSDSNLDLSPPRKAGVWWVRNSIRLGTLFSILLAAVTIATLGWSFMNRISMNKKPGELKFIEEAWYQGSKATATTDANPDAQQASLALGDLNGDGKTDLIFTDRNQNLVALDGATKKTIWINEQIRIQSAIPIVLVDLNANRLLDVLVVGRDARLRALDGVNGAEMWLSPILGETVSGAPVAADLNGDGLKDILVCTEAGQIHFGFSYVNEMDWKTTDSGMKIHGTPSAADRDGDGDSEVFVGAENGQLLIIGGGDGRISKILDLKEELHKATGSPVGAQEIHYPVVSADLNGNGILDLVVGTSGGWYLALEGGSLSRLWHDQLETQNFTSSKAAPVAGNFNEDPVADIVLTSNNALKVVKGSVDPQNRNPAAWQIAFGLHELAAPLALADFNKDGLQDVIAPLSNGTLAIVSGYDGKMLTELNNPDNPAISAALAADLGNDGSLDIVLIRKDHNIYKIQTNSAIAKNAVVWGQSYGNERNSCRYEYVRPQSGAHAVTLSVSSILFLGVFGVTSVARKKRARTIKRNQRS